MSAFLLRTSSALVLLGALVLGVSSCGEPTEEPCGPSNCAGCCSAHGCEGGGGVEACGTGGAACAVCSGGTLCQAGVCGTHGGIGWDAGQGDGGGGVTDGGGGATDGGGSSDGGTSADAGSGGVDGGGIVDAGIRPDGGSSTGDGGSVWTGGQGTCVAPRPLVLGDGGAFRVTGWLGDAGDLGTPPNSSCGGPTLREDVFSFTSPVPFSFFAGMNAGVLSLQTPCVGDSAAYCYGSHNEIGYLDAGTYFLWAQTWNPSYTLDGVIIPARQGETCHWPLPLFADGGTHAQVSERLVPPHSFADQKNQGCSAFATPRDVVYSFSTSAPMDFTAYLDTGFAVQSVGLVLMSGDCRTGTRRCLGTTTTNQTYTVYDLPPGDHFLIPNGANTTYTVTAQLKPFVVGDDCNHPQELSFDGGTSLTVTGDTSGMTQDVTYTCAQQQPRPDVVYRVRLPAVGNVTATVTPLSASFRPVVHVGPSCENFGSICHVATDGGAAVSGWSSSTSTELLIVVNGADGTFGPFRLDVTRP